LASYFTLMEGRAGGTEVVGRYSSREDEPICSNWISLYRATRATYLSHTTSEGRKKLGIQKHSHDASDPSSHEQVAPKRSNKGKTGNWLCEIKSCTSVKSL